MRTERLLHAFINSKVVGVLKDDNGTWSFKYKESWIEQYFPLSPALPLQAECIVDGSSKRSVQHFFDNLLPEEAARQLMAQDAKIDVSDRFALLEYYGAESAGAITLLTQATPPVKQDEFVDLSYEGLSERIRKLPSASLAQEAPKRMSLAGAQHKLPVCFNPDTYQLSEPKGDTASSFILKPNHSDSNNYPHTVINEWFAMTLAKRVGLDVPDTFYFKVPEPVYLIERFDRQKTSATTLRNHVIDGCQLLQITPEQKYQQCTLENLRELSEKCNQKAASRRSIFEWIVFNFLIGNDDAHLKNISFNTDKAGFSLTPFYDLLSTSCYGANQGNWMGAEMVTPLNGVKKYSDVSLDTLLKISNELKYGSAVNSKKKILQMAQVVSEEADNIYCELEGDNENKPAHLKLNTGEFQQLRTIIHGHIKEACSAISEHQRG